MRPAYLTRFNWRSTPPSPETRLRWCREPIRISVDNISSGIDIFNNLALGNLVDDLFDASTGSRTAGTASTRSGNIFNTANPAGLL